jgi:hypothetical protein
VLPQNTKQNTLQPVGENLGFQSSKKESVTARLGHDHFHNLRIRKVVGMTLFVHFHHSDRVGTGITNSGRTKSQYGATPEFGQLRILFGNLFRQEIVREKPGIVTNERGTRCRQTTIVQGQWSHDFDLVDDAREFTRDLHGGFDGINGHDDNPKQSGGSRGRHGFKANVNILGRFERVQGGQDTGIGRRVSKATEGTLKQCWQDASVETGDTAVGIQCAECSGKAGAVAVLVIDLLMMLLKDDGDVVRNK